MATVSPPKPMRHLILLLSAAVVAALACQHRSADSAPATTSTPATPSAAAPPPTEAAKSEIRQAPEYAPSSRSSERFAIDDNKYGAFAGAPNALKLGDQFPAFDVPSTGPSKRFISQDALANAPVVVVFYRGHW